MHKKFKERLEYNKLLDEIEFVNQRLNNISRSANLIDSYCKTHENICEIGNLIHLTSTMADELNFLYTITNAIVRYEKYNEESFEDIISENINSVDFEFVDD